MKIQARKCGFTGRLFANEQHYMQHLKKLRKQQQQDRAHDRSVKAWAHTLEMLQISCCSVQELQDWLNQNWQLILANAINQGYVYKQRKKVQLEFQFEQIKHSEFVSNSHAAPHDGVKNWLRDRNLPLGYPGWQGMIHIKGWDNMDGFVSNMFQVMPIHTGSGGCGTYSVSWFDSDWPSMVTYQSMMKER